MRKQSAGKSSATARKPKAAKPTSLPPLAPDHAEEELAEVLDNVVPTHGYHRLPMVGLGGSAGSIPALQDFFRVVPSDAGIAFVVILHLSSEHESSLAELLQRSTVMPVQQVTSTAKVEPNNVYVIPPGKQLVAADGHLKLANLPTDRGRRVAVDLFFRTLADTHGPSAAAVVLSGADGDGAIGIKRIKERGGLTVAQDPQEAEHPGMPHAAIETGMIDWVLPVSAIPDRLVKFYEIARRIKLPSEEEDAATKPEVPQPSRVAEYEATLREVLGYLRARTGRDFSGYKRATIVRRIGRRMQVHDIDDLPQYLAFLRTNAGEPAALLQDLLIDVTNFFRDRDAFDALETQLPQLFRDKGASDTVRVWSAGCATGEEAYSIAMLLAEYARTLDAPPQIQVFATDLDEGAIKTARDGIYPDTIAADVSQDRLRRWFLKEVRGFRVRREIRELCLFSLHDLLKDSPFSRIDLVMCRNLLIYLRREAQMRVFDIFHFALRPGGRLFLGTSETIDSEQSLFTVIDKKYRIYAQQPAPRIVLPVPIGTSALARSLEMREKGSERPTVPKSNGEGLATIGVRPALELGTTYGELHYRLIERFAPPSVLVNADYDIVHLSEQAGQFLQIAGGEPSRNLLHLVHPMLRLDVRAALFSARQAQRPAEVTDVPVELGGQSKSVDIRVSPASELAPDHFLVVFDAHSAPAGVRAERISGAEPDAVTAHLERELERTKTQLRDTVEQSEAATEELKASNEELQAVNEELRSATEELETSREELQSINEELTTVNQELRTKVDELGHANSDLNVLIASTAIATIFLDRDLRIQRYTPLAVELFNLIPTDVGRPLSDLTGRLDYPQMERDARRALGELTPVEREVHAGGHWYIARSLPYRTTDDRIGGVVFTYVDITARRQAEEALQALQAEQASDLQALLRLQELSSGLLSAAELPPLLSQFIEATIEMQKADFGTVQLYERTSGTLEMVAHRGFDASFIERFRRVNVAEGVTASTRALKQRERLVIADVEQDPAPLRDVARQAGYRALQATPLIDRNDEPLGVMTTYFREPHHPTARELRLVDLYARQAADVVSFRLAEQTLRESEERFRAIVEQTALGVAQIEFTGEVTFANYRLCEILGRTQAQMHGLRVQDIVHPDDLSRSEAMFRRLEHEGTPYELEQRLLRADGKPVWVSVTASVLRDRNGRPKCASALVLDVTERNVALQASRSSEERLRLIVENAREYAIFSMDLERRVTSWNPGAQRLLGFYESEIIGQSADVIFLPEDRAAGIPEAEARTALTDGRAVDERWHMRKDGTRFFGSGVMNAMRDAEQKTVGLIKIFRDQTQAREVSETLAKSRAELEQALRDNKLARDELEAASRAKDRFLAVLSHELRTPLTPVVMAVHTLGRRDDLPEAAREALEMIRRNIRIESHLIDDLLDLTRISRGHIEIAVEPLDLHQAIGEAIEVCMPDVEGKGQTLVVALEASRHRTDGDFNRLQQVVWNLLKNASKFTRRGGRILLSTRNEDSRFVMTVSDDGIGIEPAVLPAIFDAFSQGGEWVAREYGGLGLGLAISKATVEAHGGSIKAESGGRGQGATFRVELPLRTT